MHTYHWHHNSTALQVLVFRVREYATGKVQGVRLEPLKARRRRRRRRG